MFTFGYWDAVWFHLGPIPVDHIVVTQWACVLFIALIAYFSTRNMTVVPKGLQNFFEGLIVWTYDFFTAMMDKEHVARKWAPLLSTFFIFILVCNLSGIIPGAGHIEGFQPPTSNWNVTMTLALITFFAVIVAGVSEHKAAYLGHFISPHPIMLPLNIVEEVVRPVSLTIRLFGNIFGKEVVLGFLLFLAPFIVPATFLALAILLSVIQAIVFTILSASYIAGAAGEGH
ncbi:ATP synthase F0 sector subunit a [Candidatus Syntrophocurvum alkaliphilum]|uniref:ATP synthase subunit a n=1 Tax=Candidatus Syntrophocurvum alkaliphilum TaxID=2293317 RepID=A0A6I6DDS5_9FIRM|nr:F0F1 ATP synthase subunit A [Candidatus Syntrophocurvum alkaliphilum]QGU00725.1 ATP synthase F0 sector subunit a [Candidatus Syntrophocurvum alkaliphilum]